MYLKALTAHSAVDHVEYGNYVARTKVALLADRDERGRPVPVTSRWPVMVHDADGDVVPDARFLVQTQHIEEKGSDVNVATHLLLDVLSGAVDAAVVASNDSDLRLPVHESRLRVPVGVVNPSRRLTAGALRGQAQDGVGRHWWLQLDRADFVGNQLPQVVGTYRRPPEW